MNSTTASSSKESADSIFFGSDSCSSSPKSSSSSDEYQGNAYLDQTPTAPSDADTYDPVSSYECGSSKSKASGVKFSSPTSDSKRIINFGSGFKIPKRPSNECEKKENNEADEAPQQPPAKKQKSSNEAKPAKTSPNAKKKLVKTVSTNNEATAKSTNEASAKSTVTNADAPKKLAKKVVKRKRTIF